MAVQTGLDRLVAEDFHMLQDRTVGLLCNQASIDSRFRYASGLLRDAHQRGRLRLKALFGPQHGLWGHTQDNMIEWEGGGAEQEVKVYSLYGRHRRPTPAMLEGLDVLVVDLQDVGARYYTFIWTLAHCLEACAAEGVAVLVLDRPNPIGGQVTEGPVLDSAYASFVGLLPLPIRHGMTIGELAGYFQNQFYPECSLQVLPMRDWRRTMFFDECGVPWAMPSPNMPSPATALVYPGMCLLEGTNLSEGRGTTRPFEIFGAPWIAAEELASRLNSAGLPGIYFRPLYFQPTFQKHAGKLCGGAFLHVTDRQQFKPFLTAVAVLREVISGYRSQFSWKQPPYEYEYEKLPIDILAGNSSLREMLEAQAPLTEMEARWQRECAGFEPLRRKFWLYPE